MADFQGVPPRGNDASEFNRQIANEYLKPYFDDINERLQSGSDNTSAWVAAITGATDYWIRNHDHLFPNSVVENWANNVSKYHAERYAKDFWRVARVDLRGAFNSSELESVIEKSIKDSVALIKTIPERFHNQIEMDFIKGEKRSPLDLKSREDMFRRVGKSSGYNLRRITRDQNNKLVGNITKARHKMAGIKQYRWATSLDDRVRPTHVSKNGLLFDWEDPPTDTGHPGNDIQCRCVAIPEVTIDSIRKKYGV